MSKWISVEDRLPKNGEIVVGLDMTEMEELKRAFFVTWQVTSTASTNWYTARESDVQGPTHWMPLPGPPE